MLLVPPLTYELLWVGCYGGDGLAIESTLLPSSPQIPVSDISFIITVNHMQKIVLKSRLDFISLFLP